MKKYTKTQIKAGNAKLLKLAKILDTADEQHMRNDERTYKQSLWVHPCGAPACALGHWAAANPHRYRLVPATVGGNPYEDVGTIIRKSSGEEIGVEDSITMREFALDASEANDLFGHYGCGGAKTAQMAAEYIRDFVAGRK